jgi:hypothetical protein
MQKLIINKDIQSVSEQSKRQQKHVNMSYHIFFNPYRKRCYLPNVYSRQEHELPKCFGCLNEKERKLLVERKRKIDKQRLLLSIKRFYKRANEQFRTNKIDSLSSESMQKLTLFLFYTIYYQY